MNKQQQQQRLRSPLFLHGRSHSSELQQQKTGDLIIVSNRLPVTLEQGSNSNEFAFKKSSGGLVTALTGMNKEFKWLGWLGEEITQQEKQQQLKTELYEKHKYWPVFLNKQDAADYYNGFSNGILWPMFHYLHQRNATFNEKQWEAYKRVNQEFANAVLEIYKDGDLVWVHDYHLFLLPAMLRQRKPDIFLAFFLHIPFPSSEIYRLLPVRAELLEGVLASNLIGFHTYNFVRHFLSSCTRTLGVETTPKGLLHKGISVHVEAFPIGIDPNPFLEATVSTAVQERIQYFEKNKFRGKRILVGVDRLDYTKGIDLKFQAYEHFLRTYPEYKTSTVLIQVGVPTREAVKEYQDLISDVNEMVGRINSTYGTLEHVPIHYINKSVNLVDLCALYSCADALIVTSIRDGMNLVSSEFVACQEANKGNGVLILSEFAGAASSLGGSLIVNPWDVEATAKSIYQALEMSNVEKTARHTQNYKIVSKNTAAVWGQDFLNNFEYACSDPQSLLRPLPHLNTALLQRSISESHSKRLFLLDYDGTLEAISKYPTLVIPNAKLLDLLDSITSNPKNLAYVISGRARNNSSINMLAAVPGLGICAEQGVYTRHPHTTEWTSMYHLEDISLSWFAQVVPVLEHFESRTPGSFFEQKESSLVFHFRNCEPEYGNHQALELKSHLDSAFGQAPMEVIHCDKYIEIRPQNVNKGITAKRLIEKYQGQIDFIFCAGDDRADEDMFDVLRDTFKRSSSTAPTTRRLSISTLLQQDEQYKSQSGLTIVSCVVGKKKESKAMCSLRNHHEVLAALELFK